jgi:hypothetical protein
MGGRSVAFSSQFCLSCDHHLCLWLRIVRPGHILMFILVASYRRQVATQIRVDCSCLLVHTHTHTSKKKKKFAPISRMVVVTRQFVTGEQVLGQEQIAVADVVGMMRSFQRMSEALINRLDRDEARAPAPAEVPPRAPAVTGSIHRELEKVKFPEFFGAPDGAAAEAWLENMAMCFALRDYTSNMKVRMAVFQLKGSALLWWKTLLPQLNMAVEDVSWELFEERFRERYLSEEFIERQLNEFNALRQGGRTVPEYEARFMELLRYAPHLNTEKLKVNRFVFGLNGSLRAKVRILMPQTLHDAVQKALIAEEELISGGQTRTPSRPAGQGSAGTPQRQTPARHTPGYRGFQRGSTFTTPRRPPPQQRTPYRGPSSSSSVARSSSLDLFSRTDQGFRPVGSHLLLRAPGLLGRRRGVGRVGSHTTSAIVLWRGPERPDQSDLLQWEIWARPIGFMQR